MDFNNSGTTIDDLFESDDEDYTIESENDDIDISDDDYSRYMVNDTLEVVNEHQEEISEDNNDPLDKRIEETPVITEEKTLADEFEELKRQQQSTEEKLIEKEEELVVNTEIESEESSEYKDFDIDNELNSSNDTEEQMEEEPIVKVEIPEESNLKEDLEGDTLSETNVTDDIETDSKDKEIVYEENNDDEPGEVIEEHTETVSEIVNDETSEEDMTISEIINKNSEEAEKSESVESDNKLPFDENLDKTLEESAIKYDNKIEQEAMNDMINLFREQVQFYYKKYAETDLVNYIKEHATEEDKAAFKECYIREYCKYSLAIDFENELAESNLWVIAAGKFADHIEFLKSVGKIESEVVVDDNLNDYNSKIVEDKQVSINREYKKQQNEKFSKYKLDRTVFEIVDSEDNDDSIFDDKRTLEKDFAESKFYEIHKEVMTSDKFADMSKVQAKVICNENTSYIYIIDYSTGIRVVCLDVKDVDQYRINPMLLSRNTKFSFPERMRDFKLRVLYSDDVENRTVAVIFALKKLIGYEFYKDRYKIKINGNYVVAYTTESQWIEMFEKGDPDSKKPENSPYYLSKPANMNIGVIILSKKNNRDRQSIRRNQIAHDIGLGEQVANSDDYNIQFLLSARIVRNDLRLRNPTLVKEDRYVEYVIVQYNEANPVIVTDGFQAIVACIIKEHLENYAPGTPYSISYEYDKDGLVSPAVVRLLDECDGLEPAYGQRVGTPDVDGQFTLPPSRLKMDGVLPFEHGRLDKRYFSPITIQRKYPSDLWKKYDLSTQDGIFGFVRSRGFEEFIHLRPVKFDVMPYALNFIEQSETTSNIIKVSLPMLADRNSYDHDLMMQKQTELMYKQSLGNSPYGNFKLFVVEAVNAFIDSLAAKNNQK